MIISRCRETRLFQVVSIMRVSISAVRKDEHLQAQWSTSEELHVAHHARQQIAVQRADNLNATLRDLLQNVRITSTTQKAHLRVTTCVD
jgi:hypothetical protein